MNHSTHNALVLTGGGARGAYQAGVLKFMGENLPKSHFHSLVGSSSGAINVAGLASAGGNLQLGGPRVAELWSKLEMDQVFRTDLRSLAWIGLQWAYTLVLGGVFGRVGANYLVDTSPLRKLMEDIYQPEAVARAIQEGVLKNVAVSATEVNTGNLVTFIQTLNGKPWQRARRRAVNTEINVSHIMASSAIPLLFPSTIINNRQYVDGCIRSVNPLSPATRLGAEKVFAIGVRRYYLREQGNFDLAPLQPEAPPSPAKLAALILNSLFAEALDADVEHLERLNAIIPAKQEGSFGMRKLDIMVIRPSEDLGEMATYYRKKIPVTVRTLLKGLGSEGGKSSDILSYLLFVPEYLQALVDLGYQDARAEEARIQHFLEK